MECSKCPHVANLEACRSCNKNRKRRKIQMEVQLKTHTKLKVADIDVGKTFRLIGMMKAYQVVDLSKALPSSVPSEVQGENTIILDPSVVYCVDLTTGLVEIFPKDSEVYLCPMRSIERDEE